MRVNFLLIVMSIAISACTNGVGFEAIKTPPPNNGVVVVGPPKSIINSTDSNVIPVTVNDFGYLNEPTVSVTICESGAAKCTTINNILLDTGSSGLRIFSSLTTSLNLPTVNYLDGSEVARCASYADGTNQWGSVRKADVKLGGETISSLNIHLIDANYATVPSDCSDPENDPKLAKYNGIIGVGINDRDCPGCESDPGNNMYFSCKEKVCTSSLAPLSYQIQNPVSAITKDSNIDQIDDSNGSLLQLPSIPSTGATSVQGYLVFGINTRPNNTASSHINLIKTDTHGYFNTIHDGKMLLSFIDSGSNGLFFPASASNPKCNYWVWFCPTNTINLNAMMIPWSLGGKPSSVNFEVIDSYGASLSENWAYSNLAAETSGFFDWGLPFFYGRTVYTAISGKNTGINGGTSGPFYAY